MPDSGNFQLPEDSVPVSGVYLLLGDRKLGKPVTLELQHCATSAVSNILQILRANDDSNKFTVVPGGIFFYLMTIVDSLEEESILSVTPFKVNIYGYVNMPLCTSSISFSIAYCRK